MGAEKRPARTQRRLVGSRRSRHKCATAKPANGGSGGWLSSLRANKAALGKANCLSSKRVTCKTPNIPKKQNFF
jgi:hypothetical protein